MLSWPNSDTIAVEEIDEMFAARVPARKFQTYQCQGAVGTATAVDDGDSTEGVHTINRKTVPKVAETTFRPA